MANKTDTYFELKIKINPAIADILSNICFENFDCAGIVLAEEEYKDDLVLVSTTEETLKVYLTSIGDIAKVLEEHRKILIQRGFSQDDLGSWEFEISEIENQDWSKKWKESWDITRVSEKIVIVPSWIEYSPKPEEIIITLDPGTAFGTGTHPTTQLCMRAGEKYIEAGNEVADIGTGSGILAICAAKLGAKFVYACDNDKDVIQTATDNAKMNGVNIVVEQNTADKIDKQFDFVFANILHNVLAQIMPDLKAIMKKDAKMVLSGILDEKKQVVIDAIMANGLELIEEMQQDVWTAIIVKK